MKATSPNGIPAKFREWWVNMYKWTAFYAILFPLTQGIINGWVKPNAENWLNQNEFLVILLVSLVLGIMFILDGEISGYLKSPLARLSAQIEQTNWAETTKKNLLLQTYKTNELFKETLKKFSILSIFGLLVSIINEPQQNNGTQATKRSEKLIFYVCYLVPLLYATWNIYWINRQLIRLEKNLVPKLRRKRSFLPWCSTNLWQRKKF